MATTEVSNDESRSSWRSFSSLISNIKKKNASMVHRSEVTMLLDAVMLNKPLIVQQGFVLYDLNGAPLLEIKSLDELEIGRTYTTEKETGVIRANEDEIILGGKLIISVHCTDAPVLRGTVRADTALLALENHSRKKLSQGILFLEEDKGLCRIFYGLDQLIVNTVYISADGGMMVKRLPTGNIQFQLTNPNAPVTSDTHNFFSNATPRSVLNTQEIDTSASACLRGVSRAQWSKKEGAVQHNNDDNKENAPTNNGDSTGVVSKIKKGLKKLRSSFQTADDSQKGIELDSATDYQNNPAPPPVHTADSQSPAKDETLMVPAAPPVSLPPPPHPPAPPPLPRTKGPPPPPLPSGSPATPRAARKKMKQLHWSAIPSHQIKKAAFWNNISPVKFTRQNEKELEGLFSLSPTKAPSSVSSNKSASTHTTPQTILDLRKTNNTSILLSQFKLSPTSVRTAVLEMDNSITTEQLIALSSILSAITIQEAEAIQGTTIEALTSVELFVKEMLSVPLIEARLRSWLLLRQLDTQLADITHGLSIVAAACEEVRASASFAGILKLVLALGSILNRGTYLDSQGFRLESLLKLEDTRAKNGQVTLLHYLVDVVQQEHPHLKQVHSELAHTAGAASIALDALADSLADANDAVRAAFDLLPNTTTNSTQHKKVGDPQFIQTMTPFLTAAKERIELLTIQMNTTNDVYEKLATYYGEDPSKLSAKDFFHTIGGFLHSFERILTAPKQKPYRNK